MTEIDEASLPSRRRRALTSPSRWSKPTSPLFNFFFRGKSGRKLRLYPANPAGDSGAGMRGDCEIIIGTQWSNSVCPSRPRDWCVMLGRRLPASPACVRRNSRNKNFPSLAHSRLLRLCRPPPPSLVFPLRGTTMCHCHGGSAAGFSGVRWRWKGGKGVFFWRLTLPPHTRPKTVSPPLTKVKWLKYSCSEMWLACHTLKMPH